ncbi:hypothetical protein BV898_01648 [Hypsibius exemplaris]|uniref:Uncharacterized protein n=1 Tax=Hypsibius exemplaris TaxID=2072580 RepID=A0A1W0XB04_HYPEX|nr:hypothetical protein BV898_01648 [Hypsibius exemplaris]
MEKGNPANLVIFTPPTPGNDQAPLLVRNGGHLGAEHLLRGGGFGGRDCRYLARFKILAVLQIVLGIVLFLTGIYFHIPIFSGGKSVIPGEDRLWYATWIGVINVIVGSVGRLASKRSLSRESHKFLRRCYFVTNASVGLYCNGIGITTYIISLSHYSLVQPQPEEWFTCVMAFVCLGLLVPAFLINIVATVYQALATRQCKCWVCDPKNAKLMQTNKQLSISA